MSEQYSDFDDGDVEGLERSRKTASAKREPSPVKPCPDKSWIEVVLQDDSGERLANVLYTIETPDGEVHTGYTDGSGTVRFDGIDPGTCIVQCAVEKIGPRR